MGRLVALTLLGWLAVACGHESIPLEYRPAERDVRIHRDVGPGRETTVLEVDRRAATATIGYYAARRCGTVDGPDDVSAVYEPGAVVLVLRFPGGDGPTCDDALVGAVEVQLPMGTGTRAIRSRAVGSY